MSSPLHAEAMAALKGIERAAALGMQRIILETDAAVLGNALNSDDMDSSMYGCLFRHIKAFLASQFDQFQVLVCPRECNRVADSLASHGASVMASSSLFMSEAPEFVYSLVSGDLPGAGS